MGKHERQQIEEAEKIIVKILNSQKLNNLDRENYWIKHAFAIAKKLQEDFSNIKKAYHLGNRYDNIGDILILADEKRFFIETKMSYTKTGVGTKANISQDALTENRLFEDEPKSWSKFRKDKKHEEWVNEYLNQFKKYPKSILKITNSTLQKEEKARYLRELKKKKNKTAINILNMIHERDKKEKIEYLNYLRQQKQQKEMIKRFFVLTILGIHKQEIMDRLIKNSSFFQEIQDLFIYYSNVSQEKIIVRKENSGEKIKKILKEFSDFKIIFPIGVTHCKIVGIKKGDQQPLLQIVLHWKNIAQGIKTPCLNIFDLTA